MRMRASPLLETFQQLNLAFLIKFYWLSISTCESSVEVSDYLLMCFIFNSHMIEEVEW